MKPSLLTGPVIITRYLGPTDYRGARVVATHKRDSSRSQCQPWRKMLSWDHALSPEANHEAVAQALLGAWPYETDLQIVGRTLTTGSL
jgi:hypothetical protein